jgi:riboflavin kinase / FMN adenylyltransferase
MATMQRHTFRKAPGADRGPGSAPVPAVVTIGNFDGVHLGHQALIRRVVEDARVLGAPSALITFHPHPQAVLRSHQVPILTSLRLRLRLFEELGLDEACVIAFTPEFAQIPAERFVEDYLIAPFHLRKLIIGYDFAFGRNREGTAELLMQAAHERGFGFEVFPAVTIGNGGPGTDGITVSSTRIRGLLQAGEFAQAARLLGRPYSVLEPVIEGHKRGRQLGFPTINQLPEEPLPIPFGVYAVRARVAEQTLGGVANYGIRPTLSSTGEAGAPAPLLETHLFDFTGDLYGQVIEILPLKRLREERKFPSFDALKTQIAKDRDAARAFLATVGV